MSRFSSLLVIGAESREAQAFGVRAHNYFAAHPEAQTFTDKHPDAGVLWALRWNPQAVVVFRMPSDAIIVGDLPQGGGA